MRRRLGCEIKRMTSGESNLVYMIGVWVERSGIESVDVATLDTGKG